MTGTARGGGGVPPLKSATEFWDNISIQNFIFICVLGSKRATLASECHSLSLFRFLLCEFIFEFLFYIVAWISERVLNTLNY